jgi:very-short-patch-repair endonuclease
MWDIEAIVARVQKPPQRTADVREARRQRIRRLADKQAGVVSRRQVYGAGLTRAEVRANVLAGRWQLVGRHVVAVHNGELSQAARLWMAVLSGGPRAHLDGVAALVAAGLVNYDPGPLRVSVPRGTRVFREKGVNVRQTRRWSREDVVDVGVPRTRPEVAAARAGLWADSDRQAALVLTMTVQQGITTAERIGVELWRIKKGPRLRFLRSVVMDLLGGARSLTELDFARECRVRGLPEPSRQVLRRAANGVYYLDVSWEEWRLVVEIDGIQHIAAENVVGDALRHNDVALDGETVLRLPVLGYRVARDEFFEQITRALRGAGCPVDKPAA